jgi:hypothetical protein
MGVVWLGVGAAALGLAALLLKRIARAAVGLFRRTEAFVCRAGKIVCRTRSRVRALVLPVLRRVPNAASYSVFVLLASVVAPALLCFIVGQFTPYRFPLDPIPNALVAIVAGFTTALFVSSLRERRTKFAGEVTEKTIEAALPDGGVDVDKFPFRTKDPRWLDDGKEKKYENIDQGLRQSAEWMIVLRQARSPAHGEYSIDCLDEQIREVEKRIKRIEKELEDDECGRKPPAVRWVCFVSSSGKFYAMQRFPIFRYQIKEKRNSAYLKLLNAKTEDQFKAGVTENINRSKPQTGDEPPQYYSDAIPGMSPFWIEKGITAENALFAITAEGESDAMLISDRTDREPLGVVSSHGLATKLLLNPLKKRQLQGSQDVAGRFGRLPD